MSTTIDRPESGNMTRLLSSLLLTLGALMVVFATATLSYSSWDEWQHESTRPDGPAELELANPAPVSLEVETSSSTLIAQSAPEAIIDEAISTPAVPLDEAPPHPMNSSSA